MVSIDIELVIIHEFSADAIREILRNALDAHATRLLETFAGDIFLFATGKIRG